MNCLTLLNLFKVSLIKDSEWWFLIMILFRFQYFMHKWRLSFFLKMNKIDISVKFMKCLIHSFVKTLFKYCFKEHTSSWSSTEHETAIRFASLSNRSKSHHQNADA